MARFQAGQRGQGSENPANRLGIGIPGPVLVLGDRSTFNAAEWEIS